MLVVADPLEKESVRNESAVEHGMLELYTFNCRACSTTAWCSRTSTVIYCCFLGWRALADRLVHPQIKHHIGRLKCNRPVSRSVVRGVAGMGYGLYSLQPSSSMTAAVV